MNKTIDALKLAEEALVKSNHFHDYEDELAAIREALAEQPMVLDDPHPPNRCCECADCLEYFKGRSCDDYAEPVKQEPVELGYCRAEKMCRAWCGNSACVSNQAAPVQPVKQEPVAWHEPNAYGNVTTHKKWALENGWLPLYTKE